ncbi:MAG: response regulator [Ruminococcus sp.]|nr:response regulator [Ruminococcus sp.]
MDNQLVWKEEYNIGVDVIDKEHQRLFKIINKLFAFGKEEKKSQWICQEGIKYFKEHAIKHFTDEENYMASIEYKDLETHRHLHKGFREKTLPALEQELEQMEYSSDTVEHFLGVCAGWLIGHTLTEDRAITGTNTNKWVDLLPDEEHNTMKKTIIQLIYDMFQLESHVVSESYGGEKFGKGVYYRLVYATEQEETWEIFLVFEEKLLINTVGKVLGLQSNKLDSMLINAARYTAQQFVGRIREHLPIANLCEMKEENLLTYEQFRKVFESEKPQFSLLFDTGAGYFSFCVIAPHLLQNGVGTPIKAENAMTEIEEYLKRKKSSEINEKQKILVVDDSLTIREGMRELLENDYEITLAKSGTSAFRSIALNKPDLVLLDYEMPVCDGRQVLEMIRSEEEFASIPVFFLTGRVDQESVQKVISLKPEGYLSKYLKPAEIKMNIDKFFERKSSKNTES